MGEQSFYENSVSYERLGPGHKFIGILLSTLKLDHLCHEYDDSIVYALSGVPFFSTLTAEGTWQPDMEAAWETIKFVEDLLYNLKLEFEVISAFGGIYNEEYFVSRIYEHLYLRNPIITKLRTNREWVNIENYNQSDKSLTIKYASGVTKCLDNWYSKLDDIVLYAYPNQTYIFNPNLICQSISRQALNLRIIDQWSTTDNVSRKIICRDSILERLKVLKIYKSYAIHCMVKLAEFWEGFQETVNGYRRIMSEIESCCQILNSTENGEAIASHLSTLFSLEQETIFNLLHWINIYIPQGI